METYDPEPKTTTNNISIPLSDCKPEINIFHRDVGLMILDDVLTSNECRDIINSISFDTINKNRSKVRGNCPEFSDTIFERCKLYITKNVYKKDFEFKVSDHRDDHHYWNSPYINPCWRIVKCFPGSSLSSHFDGRYVVNCDEASIYTIMIYLSDNEDGAVSFPTVSHCVNILPKCGRVVIFNQNLLHYGDINSKLKYFIRSELIYHRAKKMATDADTRAVRLYREAERYHFSQPTYARDLEKQAFSLSPLLETMILNL
jgi:hypothetical protein